MFRDIPLNKLVASPRNVRRHHDDVADAQLKADIGARGLLQNLVVRAGHGGRFEVEAGGRRLKALHALSIDKAIAKTMPVTCLVLDSDEGAAREASLAENFHKLVMNPADEAEAFASIMAAGACVEDVARRFGLTVRFVEGRLRLASLAPCVFEALASGDITLDLAKAYGATSDVGRQEAVFNELRQTPYRVTADTVRRIMLTATVTAADPRARLVGRDAYTGEGGRIDRELFDNDDSEAWIDVALLERLATEKMDAAAKVMVENEGLAWVRPSLDSYLGYNACEGLTRVSVPTAPMSEAEIERLSTLEADYDGHAAILDDENADPADCTAAEEAIVRIDAEMTAIRTRPPLIDSAFKAELGAFLMLGRDGTPRLESGFYVEAEPDADLQGEDDAIEVVESGDGVALKRATLSQRLVDELAMQRRDILALHLANDPALALDMAVFAITDRQRIGWTDGAGSTLQAPTASGPVHGFEAKDAPATAALAEHRAGLDKSWCSGETKAARYAAYRALDDDVRAVWLGTVVARSLEASLNVAGPRACRFHDHLGMLIGIDVAGWWRPTAANYFDRVSKAVILDAFAEVGGPELASRYEQSKKADLAATAERIFSGNFIAEVEVKERALAWLPPAMRFADEPTAQAIDDDAVTPAVDDQDDVGVLPASFEETELAA